MGDRGLGDIATVVALEGTGKARSVARERARHRHPRATGRRERLPRAVHARTARAAGRLARPPPRAPHELNRCCAVIRALAGRAGVLPFHRRVLGANCESVPCSADGCCTPLTPPPPPPPDAPLMFMLELTVRRLRTSATGEPAMYCDWCCA